MSEDGRHGLTLIAFVGSVFSPYYARSRRLGAANPMDHCALNVALYNPNHHRWAMTERGQALCRRDERHFQIGPSELAWDGQSLRIRIRERGVPWPHPIEGEVRVWPQVLHPEVHALDAKGQHVWGPIATHARIEVALSAPDLSWSGSAYLDANQGAEPIEAGFHQWDWSRALMPDGSTLVHYDIHGDAKTLAPDEPRGDRLLRLLYWPDGRIDTLGDVPAWSLPPTRWRVPRQVRSDSQPLAIKTLEDTPFYQRGLVSQSHAGHSVVAFHESLSVPRLVHPVVQSLLPWRMPRKTRS